MPWLRNISIIHVIEGELKVQSSKFHYLLPYVTIIPHTLSGFMFWSRVPFSIISISFRMATRQDSKSLQLNEQCLFFISYFFFMHIRLINFFKQNWKRNKHKIQTTDIITSWRHIKVSKICLWRRQCIDNISFFRQWMNLMQKYIS